MAEAKTLTPEEFRRLQLVQLDMLVELDRVCRQNNIPYTMFGGTMLGAVRHKGYIPWDDDADVAMLREDYERFKRVLGQLNPDICYFQDHTTDPGYRWGYGKLRRTGTTFVRAGQEHLKGKTGVFIDIFPFDDVPLSTIGQMCNDFYNFCLRKILWSEVGKYGEKNRFKRFVYRQLSKIPPEKALARYDRMAAKSRYDSPNRVRQLLMPASGKAYNKNPIKVRYGMPKQWLKNLAEYEFEGHLLYGFQDYDAYLSYTYGDYMTPPPESERGVHAPVSEYHF